MAKPVAGFMSDDAQFFESKEEADLHEAQIDLSLALSQRGVQSVDAFIKAVEVCSEEIARYIEARQAVRQGLDDLGYTADDLAGEDDAEAVQPQSANGGQSVSNVGGSEQSQEVRHQRTEHGAGVRKRNARRIRRGPGMAVGTRPRTEKARARDRRADARKGKVEEDHADD